jgi:hypothetical protein
MQIQLTNGYITGYATIGGFPDGIEVDESFLEQMEEDKIGFYKYENGAAVLDEEKWNTAQTLSSQNEIRQRRESECFPIINRGKPWYDTLTEEQLTELNIWYKKWLDAPETNILPEKPNWLIEAIHKI